METTNAQLADNYRKDGFLTGIHVSDEVEATRHRQAYNVLEAEAGAEKCEIGLVDWHFDYQFIWELAIHPKIVDVIEALIGPRCDAVSHPFLLQVRSPRQVRRVASRRDILGA